MVNRPICMKMKPRWVSKNLFILLIAPPNIKSNVSTAIFEIAKFVMLTKVSGYTLFLNTEGKME